MWQRFLPAVPAVPVVVVALVLLTAARAPQLASAAADYYVTDALTRVPPDALPPSGAPKAIRVTAAAGEFEGVQIVLHGGGAGLRQVDLRLTGPLATAAGAAIPVEAVAFYRLHYVTVRSASGLGGRPGSYPDALIPLRNPFTGERLAGGRYPASPFDVAPGRNQPVYVEVFVPPASRPGVYEGSIRIEREDGALLGEVPLSVQVLRFALPPRAALRTNFQGYDAGYAGVARYLGYAAGDGRHRAVARAIDEMLLAHRLTPESPPGTLFDLDEDGTIRPDGAGAARLLDYLRRPEFSEYLLPFGSHYPYAKPTTEERWRACNYLRSAYAWFAARGFEDRLVLRPGDEPSRREDFIAVRELADLAREANPNSRSR